jgi:hypothetical protein
LADIEELYLTADHETEPERTKRKANKRNAMSRLNAELRKQTDVQPFREHRTSVDNSRPKCLRLSERRAAMSLEGRPQAPEMNAGHQ